jgi:RNA polymerase sigma factor (sigma-70 family)
MAVEPQADFKKLVRRCVANDEKAFHELYNIMSPVLYTICLRYMGQPSDAQDALQETFIRLFKNLSRFTFSGSFQGWCKRIAVNTSIELLRKRKKVYFTDVDEVQIGLNPKSLEKLKMEDLLALVQELPTGYRTVFNMYVIEGYSHKEIGEQLGISENTSKTQLFKSRKALQQKVNEHYS